MAVKIFIDGQAGTTGLRIHERLADRNDLTMITLTEETRKDPEARRAAILESDVTFLCLPDDAAREAVALAGDADVRIIDASTAHRTNPDWHTVFRNCRRSIGKRFATPSVWQCRAVMPAGSLRWCIPWYTADCCPRTIRCSASPCPATAAAARK